MKRFILHTGIFLMITILTCLIIICFADGTADPYYLKFTTKKQNSLIVGSSRAAQGLQPEIINKVLDGETIFNYAFTILHSPFGEPYFNSIRKKVRIDDTKGIFIVAVNPWTISSQLMGVNSEDALEFRENNSFIDKTNYVNLNPNIEYIFESYQHKNMHLLTNKFKVGKHETTKVHHDGWLEVIVDKNEAFRIDRTLRKIASYKEKLNTYNGYSETRYEYLKKTIEFLKQNGTVYLLRIPVCDEMYEIENSLISDFNIKMKALSKMYQVDYIDASVNRNDYTYLDGQHLDIKSGKVFSEWIAKKIKQVETTKSF